MLEIATIVQIVRDTGSRKASDRCPCAVALLMWRAYPACIAIGCQAGTVIKPVSRSTHVADSVAVGLVSTSQYSVLSSAVAAIWIL